MMITKLKLLVLHTMLVAGVDERFAEGSLSEMFPGDLKVVLTALQRSNPQEMRIPPGALDTPSSTIQFADFDADRIGRVMAGFTELDLTGMKLRRLPVYGMRLMTGLRRVILDDNDELTISPGMIRIIRRMPIEDISIRNSGLRRGTFRALQKLPSLIRLDVSGNESLSTLPDNDKFGNLTTRLVELRAANCGLGNGWLDSILGCINLKFLDVSENPGLFENRVPNADCSLMRGLTGLSVAGCGLRGAWLDDIFRCTNLTALNISKNASLFENRVPSADCSFMRSLTTLCISWCKPSSEWLDDIFRCTNLVNLDMSFNGDIGANHTNFSKFKNLKSLRGLRISRCKLTAMSLSEICKCGGLEVLCVSWNKFLWANDEVDLGACRESLKVLDAESTGLDENGLRALCGPPSTVGHGDSIPRTMEGDGLPNLTVLDIGWNKALGPVISSRRGFSFGRPEKTLTELGVAGIGITGSIAFRVIERFEKLAELNTSFNKNVWRDTIDTFEFGRLRLGLEELNIRSPELRPDVLSKVLEFEHLVELKVHHNDRSRGGLVSNEGKISGARDTLRRINVEETDLTGDGLRGIFEEFSLLEKVDARRNPLITPADLLGLDFGRLGNTLVVLKITTDSEAAADLQKKLPMTMVYHYQ